jgi:1,4-dihydroxy-2-naphthoyl-CoA hydrolase
VFSPKELNEIASDLLPGHLGIKVTHMSETEVRAEVEIKKFHLAPNGFLHAASIIALADSACGNGCICNLPQGASGFTTVELKSNHLGTTREGIIDCVAKAVHKGRTTQVWDAVVTKKDSGKTIALFRCTQMILYPSPPSA